MNNTDRVIVIALGKLGYREKVSSIALDDSQTYAGSSNWTKCAMDPAAGYYNGNKKQI